LRRGPRDGRARRRLRQARLVSRGRRREHAARARAARVPHPADPRSVCRCSAGVRCCHARGPDRGRRHHARHCGQGRRVVARPDRAGKASGFDRFGAGKRARDRSCRIASCGRRAGAACPRSRPSRFSRRALPWRQAGRTARSGAARRHQGGDPAKRTCPISTGSRYARDGGRERFKESRSWPSRN
jgi:hypothetical protein